MKKKSIFIIANLVLLVLLSFCLTSCKKDDGDPNHFTYLLSKQEDPVYYDSYENNPIMKRLLAKEWGGNKIDINFYGMVSGSENEQFNNMIATGQYYDIMDMTYSNYTAEALYNMGITLDLTELVEENMPNYMARMEQWPTLKKATYSTINGEKKILQIYGYNDAVRPAFEGFCYRRDWIIKYGTNPGTGEKFNVIKKDEGKESLRVGGYQDDVKFPSWYNEELKSWFLTNVDETWDGSEPVFISDWEWMLGIFKKAISAERISDGYCMSIYYPGFTESGDFFNAFGGGGPMWYNDNGTSKFGGTSDSMKAYLECMNTWYSNDWIDKRFDEHTQDMFYSIETAKVHAGKVGLWQGRVAELGAEMEDAANFPYTEGIFAVGCRQPINDLYGTDACKLKIPYTTYQYSPLDLSIVITDLAEGKNIASFLKMIDYLYTEEGALLGKKGLTKEQVEESQDEWYIKFGLTEGTYYIDYDANGERWIHQTQQSADANTYVVNASMLNRIVVGLYQAHNYDNGNGGLRLDAQNLWNFYLNTGFYGDLENGKLTEEESLNRSVVRSEVSTLMNTEIPKFIKGTYNLDSDWTTYAKKLNKKDHQSVTDSYQRVLDDLNS